MANNDKPIGLKDIVGGFFVILLMLIAAFVFMGVFSFAWDGIKSILQWINNPLITILVILGFVIFAGFFFSLVKLAEFGFNIRRFVNSLKNHFR